MKIELNKKLDKEVYLAFCDTAVGGVDFGEKIRDDHPNITKENYVEYIDNFYTSNKDKLDNVLEDTLACFDEIKGPLFFELKKYFGKDYGKENYICYLSIFNCNPRYLENKSFQVYYKRSRGMRKEVIAHELTHFAFFDYCDTHFAEKVKGLDKYSGKFWELSEIFNVIILNTPLFAELIGHEEKLFYPELAEKLAQAKIIWDRVSGDVDQFIDSFI